MATKRKPAAKLDSMLDAKKRALAEMQAKNEVAIAKRQKLIDDAPRRAEEVAKRRREALIARRVRTEARFNPVVIHDPRHTYTAEPMVPARRLRKHRNQGMYQFFALCLILAAVVCWLYFKYIRIQ